AGPGRFGDGKPGSPLIICEKAEVTRTAGANVRVLCVEVSEELFPLLKQNLAPFPFANALRGTFADQLPSIEQSARAATVFLYVDPFAVEGLDWAGLESVFGHVRQSGSSVEVLLNFNAASFVRRALSALKEEVPLPDPAIEDPEEIDARD